MPDAKPPVLCPPDPLREFVAAVARRMGADLDVAAELARHLVGSNLAGHDSHGVIRVPQYVGDTDQGHLVPSARPVLARGGTVAGLVDARRGFGQHSTMFALEWAHRAGAPARGGDGGGPALDSHRAARRVRRAHSRRGPDRHRDGGGGGCRHRRRRALRGPDALSRDQPLGTLGARAPAPLHLRCRDVHDGRGQGPCGAGGWKAAAARRHRGCGRAPHP